MLIVAGFLERLLHHTILLQVRNKSNSNEKGEEVGFHRNIATCMHF